MCYLFRFEKQKNPKKVKNVKTFFFGIFPRKNLHFFVLFFSIFFLTISDKKDKRNGKFEEPQKRKNFIKIFDNFFDNFRFFFFTILKIFYCFFFSFFYFFFRKNPATISSTLPNENAKIAKIFFFFSKKNYNQKKSKEK